MAYPGKEGRRPKQSVHNELHGRPLATGGEYAIADAALKEIKDHLNRSRISLQQRRAYVVEPGAWRFNTVFKRLEIEPNYFAGMSAGDSFAFNTDAKVLEARPNIQAEFVTVFSPEATRSVLDNLGRRDDDAPASRFRAQEREMKQRRDALGADGQRGLRIMANRGITEHFIELQESDANLKWLADCDPQQQMLWFEQSDYVWRKKRDFAERLHTQPDDHHRNLKRIFIPDYVWPEPPVRTLPATAWIDEGLRNAEGDGTREQRDFVEKALASDDFTFVWGPAGSGKTTAICEFVRQCVQRQERVLMVASTHVAVDNVLLKLMAPSGQGLKEVIPVRVGRGEKVDPKVQSRLLDQFLLDEITRMLASLAAAEQAGSAGASVQLMGKSLRKLEKELRDKVRGADQDPLAKLILASANFVCGTSLGILQHPTIRGGMEGGDYPVWDHLILDEASKTTIDEFLVPALCARRWIIVGDPNQLAPYCDNGEIGSALLADLTAPRRETEITEGPERPSSGLPDELKRLLAEVIQRALDERSTRLAGGIFWTDAKAGYEASLRQLREFAGDDWPDLPTRLENVLRIITPSVLESLLAAPDAPAPVPSLLPPFPAAALAARMVRLEFQHRMDRRIAEFCRRHVYQGKQLITASHVQRPSLYGAEHERMVLLEAVPAARQILAALPDSRHEQESPLQVALALHEVMAYAETMPTGSSDKTAYIISTYRRQNQLVRQVIEYVASVCPELWRGLVVTANTVDSCQGHEADLVVLSLVRKHQTTFMRSSNRMNVAFTRAKSKMVIVGPLPAKTKEGSAYADDRTLLDHLHDYEHLVHSQCAGSARLERAVQLTKEALTQR
jgi:hypothetical protein